MRVFVTQWHCLFSFMKKKKERFKSLILYYCICPIIKRRRKKKIKTLTQSELKSSSNGLYFMLYFLSFVLNIFKGKWYFHIIFWYTRYIYLVLNIFFLLLNIIVRRSNCPFLLPSHKLQEVDTLISNTVLHIPRAIFFYFILLSHKLQKLTTHMYPLHTYAMWHIWNTSN